MLFDDAKHKFNFMKWFLAHDIKLVYIDIDLLITGYIKSNVINPKSSLELHIPEDLKELTATIAEIASRKDEQIVVIDSFDTLEELYNDHLLSIYLSILLSTKNLRVVVVSNTRRWFLEHLSEVILSISDNISVIKHPDNNGVTL